MKSGTYILNVDFNNMCRYALLQLLPDGGFVFVEYLSMFTFFVILKYGKGNDIGYTLMVNFKSNHLFC